MKTCSTCGAESPNEAKFCEECGSALDTVRPAPEVVQETAPEPEETIRPAPKIDFEEPKGWSRQDEDVTNEEIVSGYSGNQYNSQKPVEVMQPIDGEEDLPERFRLIHAWGYVGYWLLWSIPVIGTIFLIYSALSQKRLNRMHFARSYFAGLLLFLIILGIGLLVLMFTGVFDRIVEFIRPFVEPYQ